MEKECKICGKYFETDSVKRCNCDDCSTNYRKRKREYANAYIASKRRMNNLYEPKVIEKTCDGCGKQYKTIYRLLLFWNHNGDKKYFCTEQCRNHYMAANSYCSVCGKSMIDNDRFNPNNKTGIYYCSDECKKKWELRKAWKSENVKICKQCGKKFVGGGKYFCSKECYDVAIKSGWRTEKKAKETRVIRKFTCVVCGKTIVKECNPNDYVNLSTFVCSDECQEKYDQIKIKKIKNDKIKVATDKNNYNNVKTALCIDCCVSYKKCERMQTNFKVLPKGAKYNDEGVLVICPRYISSNNKKIG